jgi:P22 coat protein - gene protein 5
LNQLLTIGMVTMESLPVLENELTFTKEVVREYDKDFGKQGAQIGTILNIRKPPKYTGRSGQGLSTEDAIETVVQLVLTTQFGVDTTFTSEDFTLNIENFSDRFLKPAMARIANKIDADGLLQYLNVANSVGVPGTPPNALLTYLQAMQKLNDNAAAKTPRAIIINQAMEPPIVDALKGLFQSSERIREQYEEGYMGYAIGAAWAMDQNVAINTIGTLNGATTITINAGGQSGSSLVLSNAGSVTNLFLQGNVFTIGSGTTGTYSVNPQEKTSTGSLQCFTVTSNVTSSGGAATVNIYPAIVLSGPFQNVVAAPSAGASINVFGAAGVNSPQGLCFHKGSFALGMADMVLPTGGVIMAERKSSDQLGLSMRYIKAYDINSDRLPGRFDVLYGWTTLYGETACRVMS